MLKKIKTEKLQDFSGASWIDAPFHGNIRFVRKISLETELDCDVSFAAVPCFRIEIDGFFAGESDLQYTRDRIFLESFHLQLAPGIHEIEVLVLDYENFKYAPLSRMRRAIGFFCLAEGSAADILNTGKSAWLCREESRISYEIQNIPFFQCVAGCMKMDLSIPKSEKLFPPLAREPGVDAWSFRQTEMDSRRLSPSLLPPFENRIIPNIRIRHVDFLPEGVYSSAHEQKCQDIFEIPAHSVRRILLEFDDYYCTKYAFQTSGGRGSEIRISWAEGLYDPQNRKGNRDQIEGKTFNGLCDRFFPGDSGIGCFFIMDYRAGKYVEIFVHTGAFPLKMTCPEFRESRYPMERKDHLPCAVKRFEPILKKAFRTLQMCAHDTLMDCPYYEQLMYAGDGRLQLLAAYAAAKDLRLADHAMLLWSEGLRSEGLFQSLYPARTCQIIPGFSLLYIAAVSDYIRYRNQKEVTDRIFPMALRSLMAWEDMRDSETGVIAVKRGWLFADWAKDWEQGRPPVSKDGVSGFFNALYLYTLYEFAEACGTRGEPELESRFRRIADELYPKIESVFFRAKTNLFSDLPDEDLYSEHTNSLMLLSGKLSEGMLARIEEALFNPKVPVKKATVYFTFYPMLAALKMKNMKAFAEYFSPWLEMEKLGLCTLLESPEPSRSDCHGWSAHPLYLFSLLDKEDWKNFSAHLKKNGNAADE